MPSEIFVVLTITHNMLSGLKMESAACGVEQVDLIEMLAKSTNGVLHSCFTTKKQLLGADGIPLSPEKNSRQRKGSLMQVRDT